MTKFLDLRKMVQPQVEVIYKTLVKRQPWYLEIAKIFSAVIIVGLVVWGISQADFEGTIFSETASPSPIGIFGTVESLNDSTLSLINAQGSEFTGHTSFTVNLSNLQKVETSDYDSRTLADVQVGDSIIAHGILNVDVIDADSIVTFSGQTPVEPLVTATNVVTMLDTATSTESLATTTPEVATTSPDTSTTTPDITETTTLDTSTTTPEIVTDTSTSTP